MLLSLENYIFWSQRYAEPPNAKYIMLILLLKFSEIFSLGYGHSAGIVGVDLLAQGIGCVIGLVVTMKLLGYVYKRQMRSEKGYNPESR